LHAANSSLQNLPEFINSRLNSGIVWELAYLFYGTSQVYIPKEENTQNHKLSFVLYGCESCSLAISQ
jgi:tryptophan-rich sensory protein